MAVGQGYSKVVTSGSVFWYDTGDMINSFKGKPGTNSLDGVTRNYDGYSLSTYTNGKLFETNGYTETVNIPALGNRTVESIEIYNVYSGYGTDGNYNCCPNLFRYSLTGWNGTQLSGNTLYMYEIIYKCESGYTNPNYMYHYETRADSTYNTEFGVHDDSRRISLGDGWYYAWGGFTTQATTAQGYFGLWYYNYNIRDKVSIASISLQQGNSVLPPRQFIPGATTRSNTQGLLDLSGNSTLDVSNVSFNSTGMIAFDGTNDYIQTALTGTYSKITYEFMGFFDDPTLNVYSRDESAFGDWTNNRIHFGTRWSVGMHWNVNGVWNQIPTTNLRYGWNHYCLVWDNVNNQKLVYINGILSDSNTTNGNITMGDFKIGVATNLNYYYKGNIDVLKVYTRAITAGEILQNYNHYKTRFNLP